MDLSQISIGFQTALQPTNLLFCLVGVILGQIVGVLPGLGPAAAISLLLPLSFALSAETAIIMLAGIYYGAMYGGTVTSILLNVPGEAAAVVTCLDGYQMARQGRAGPALGIAAFGSFIAGTVSTLALMFLAPSLAEIALKFGPPEYFSLMLLGMAMLVVFVSGSILKGVSMALVGIILGSIGMDAISGKARFTLGFQELMDGVGLIPVIMGLFGIAEVLISVEEISEIKIFESKLKNILPNMKDWSDSIWPIIRGSVIGFFAGILPGGGTVFAAFASYAAEKKISKYPEKFGTGMIQGVAAPESANNAAATGAFVPLLALGIPANAVMALLLGALLIHGVTPGPMLFSLKPEIAWGFIISMFIGNMMLLFLNIPLIAIWVKCLKVPYQIMFPIILLFCLIGSYSLNYSTTEVAFMLFFGLVGYLMKKSKYEPTLLILALILTPMLENYLRQSLIISQGNPAVFVSRPISLGFIAIALILFFLPIFSSIRNRRNALIRHSQDA